MQAVVAHAARTLRLRDRTSGVALPHGAVLVQPYAPALINRESRHDAAISISISAEMTTGEVERQAGDAVDGASMGSGGGPVEAEKDLGDQLAIAARRLSSYGPEAGDRQ